MQHLQFLQKNLKLKLREWCCSICGTNHDRDVNATIDIKKFALQSQNLVAI
jgi:putative transposase